jgi:hypothetical protein
VIFEPGELVEKLAALVPPPRSNLVRYHGILAPSAAWRPLVVPESPACDACTHRDCPAAAADATNATNAKKRGDCRQRPDFKYVRHELKDLEIKFARCGEVAWFYCVLDDINKYKGEPASWENARWTGVVEKRDGKWVVVQQHFSFASDK